MKSFIKEYKYLFLSIACLILFFIFSTNNSNANIEANISFDNESTYLHKERTTELNTRSLEGIKRHSYGIHESNVKRIIINDKEINQEVIPVGVDSEGRVATANNAIDLTWYARTGDKVTNIIIAGHRDYTDGIGVLSGSELWEKGLQLEIIFENGTKETFELSHKYNYTPEETPSEIMNTETGGYRVTLITCVGEFIKGQGYENRIYNVFTFVP